MKIVPLQKSDAVIVSVIHSEALKGDFLPSLGFNFLKAFYEGIIGRKEVYGFGFKEDGKIAGFVIGTNDSNNFFSTALKANFLKLSLLILIQILKKPTVIKKILETFLYPSKDVGPKAELIVIAVGNKWQGKGIGKLLIKKLEETFNNNKIKRFKLTVHANKEAVGFYEHLKFSHISSFKLYDKMWFVYEKKI